MDTSNKTIYFIDGDMDSPPPPPMPDSEESKRWFKEAWAVELLEFAGDSAKGLTEEAIGELSEAELLLLCEKIRDGIANSAEMQQQQAAAIEYTRVAERWKSIAERSGNPNAAAVSLYTNHVLSEHMAALELLEEAADDPTKAIRAAERLGKGIGYIFLAADVAGAFQNGANNPRGVAGELAGILLGGAVSGYLMAAAGGLAAIIGAPVGMAIAAIGTILVAGYAATQLGEFIWEAVFEDAVWDILESVGWKDNVENMLRWIGNTIDPFVPGDPEGGDSKPIHVAGGELATGNENENIVVGNSGSNSIIFMKGRTTAYGKGGDDDYTLYSSAVGNQLINDTEGENTLSFGIVDIANVTYKKTGENRYASPEDYFTLSYHNPGNGGAATLVVSSKHYPNATVTLLNWKNGDFGLTLPGMPVPPEPPVPNNNGTASGDYINPGMTGPGGEGIVARGFGGRDMIWGGDKETDDRLYGDGEGDIINGRGGKDEIDGGDGDDFISGFGDGSIVYGGAGDDVIDAGAYFGFEYWSGGIIDLTLADVWNDVGQYFTWTRGEDFLFTTNGDLLAPVQFNLAGQFDYSGESSLPGWSYRFFRFEDSSGYRLKYYNADHPDGWPAGGGRISFDANPYQATQGVTLHGGSGQDSINGSGGNDSIDGGDDDDLISSMAGNDSIDGGDGNDKIAGGLGADVLNGGAGDDIVAGGLGRDVISGGDGDDVLWGDNGLADEDLQGEGDYIDGGGGDDSIVGEGGDDILDGGTGNDRIEGGQGDDLLLGGEGDDSLLGGAGRDVLFGHAGKDSMYGDEGDDSLSGGDGDDAMSGGAGNDALSGGADNDRLFGDEGDDQLDGNEGDDQLLGGDGADKLRGGTGDDELVGDSGDDLLEGGQGNDKLWGDSGRDTLDGDDGDDNLQGGAGGDRLIGGAGADHLFGEDDNDLLQGGDGNDTLQGGAGDDTLEGGAGNDYLAGDDFQGSAQGNDHLNGGAGADILAGGGGNDVLDGGEGNDQLEGGAGNDVMIGGRGDDVFLIRTGEGHDTVGGLADAGAGNDMIRLTSNDTDSVQLSRDGDNLVIQLGPDQSVTLEGFFTENSNQHRVEFAYGYSYDRAGILALMGIGGPNNDYLVGRVGDDELLGNEGNDYLDGRDGNDRLIGGEGDDTLLGGSGDDLLDGGDGNDDLRGGEGRDIYRFDAGSGHDTIEDRDANSIVQLGPDIELEALNVERQGDDAVLTVVGNLDWSLRLRSYFAAPLGSAPPILLHDGRQLTQQTMREAVLRPTEGDDSLTGYETDEIISGGSGNDYISGRAGDDMLDGGEGNDLLYGDEGNDTLIGGVGDDSLNGGEGHNALYGGEGDDILDARNGSALMDGGAGEDTLSGSELDDTYVFSRGNQSDWVRYGTRGGNDTLRLGPDISLADLEFELDTNMFTGLSMTLRIKGTDDVFKIYIALDVTDESVVGTGEIEQVEFADGTVMSAADFHAYAVAHSTLSGTPDQSRVGTAADEVLVGDDAGEWIYGMGGNDHITGGAGDDKIRAGLGDDVVYGGGGDDTLRGGTGADHLHGGIGNDALLGGYGDDSFYFNAGDGWDTVADGWANGSPYDDLDGGGFDRLYLGEGLSPADVVVTRDYQDRLTMHFVGRPDDGIVLDNQFWYGEPGPGAVEEIVFADGTVWSTQDLLAHVDAAPGVARVLPPAPALAGKTFSYTLPADLFTDNGPLTWEVLNYPEWLQYDAAARTLSGLVPSDQQSTYGVVVTATDSFGQKAQTYFDVVWATEVEGTTESDTLTGTAYAEAMFGYAGNDRLDGRGGADFMYGGTGDDAYTVDHGDDQAIELAGEGADSVSATVSYTLGDNVENLSLTGTGAIDGTGNVAGNSISGNNQNNRLWGMDGDDVLEGGYGDDQLFGGNGNDQLDGGWGRDVLDGGQGNDIYILNSLDDVVVELEEGGIDLVKSSATSHALANNVENLLITNGGEGTGNSLGNTMTGDGLANRLFGMAGDDILDGKGGQDELYGGVGSDTYILGSGFGSDTIIETSSNAGDHDTARFTLSTYDQLWLTRETGSNDLTVAVLGGQNLLVVQDWFLGEAHRLESFEAGGRVLQASDVDALMAAMEQTGKTDRSALNTVQKQAMQPIWDAAWKPKGAASSSELAGLVSAMSHFRGNEQVGSIDDGISTEQALVAHRLMAGTTWRSKPEGVPTVLL